MKTLTEEQKGLISLYAAESERLGNIHPEVLNLAYDQQWFKLFVPQVYGGPGKKLPEILRLEEALAEIDGSLAWNVTLCSGASWFAGFIDPDLALTLFSDPKVCFAGSGAVGGIATAIDNGYLLSGSWQYASGALHATVFTANCILRDRNGNDLLDASGNVIIKSFLLTKDEVNVLPGWSYFGLIATGSHAFEVTDLIVPINRSFEINLQVQVDETGFDYPFLQLAETTLSVNIAGMAQHFLSLVSQIFYARSGLQRFNETQLAYFNTVFATCKDEFEEARTNFYTAFDQSWEHLLAVNAIDDQMLGEVSLASRKLAHVARRLTDTLFPYCGLEAAKKETELNRVWRDIHTASQHSLLTFEK